MSQDEPTSLRILVTGGTGFIGRALVAALRDRGHDITAMGRDPRPIAALLRDRPGNPAGSVRFLHADLRDRPAVVAGCAGHDIVIHAGALTAPWGRRRDFDATNVAGTASVIMGGAAHQVKRLIYVSSPSVVFNFTDQFDLRDDAPFPRRFSSDYARTKALGEVLVRRAARRGMETVIVRPRAVFGPGDTTLFPRLLRVARLGRLPRIGPGDNVTELTYIDNVVEALILAMDVSTARGQVYTITNGRPVALWPVIDRVLATQGLHTSAHTVPLPVAMLVARGIEAVWRLLRMASEPPVTRYSLGLLGYSQTFDARAAREGLGYTPVVSMEDGITRTLAWLQAHDEMAAGAGRAEHAETMANQAAAASIDGRGDAEPVVVTCEVVAAGYCRQSYHLMVKGGDKREMALPATFALLRHPTHGVILFDTGYAPRSKDAAASLPFSLYERLLPVTIAPAWSAVAQLERRGIGPLDVRHVILSHFHADHMGGLRDFPSATFIATEAAYARIRGLRGWPALRAAYIPSLLPEDFAVRLRQIPLTDARSPRADTGTADFHPWSVFPRTFDLFGDGTIVLMPLPGHAAGQVGALVRTSRSSRVLLAADGCWASPAYRERRMPPVFVAPIMDSWCEARRTLGRLHAIWRTEPELTIVPCHCPEQHDRLLADMGVPEALLWHGASAAAR